MTKIAIKMPKFKASLCIDCTHKCENVAEKALIICQDYVMACEHFECKWKSGASEFYRWRYAEKIERKEVK